MLKNAKQAILYYPVDVISMFHPVAWLYYIVCPFYNKCAQKLSKNSKIVMFLFIFFLFFQCFFHFLCKKCNNYKNNCIFAKHITTNVIYRFQR